MNWGAVIPKAIPMKRLSTENIYTTKLELEAEQTSKLFRAKVEADLKRMHENNKRDIYKPS